MHSAGRESVLFVEVSLVPRTMSHGRELVDVIRVGRVSLLMWLGSAWSPCGQSTQ